MKKRNLIYTGLLMLSLVTTPVYAQDKRVEVTNGICMLEEEVQVLSFRLMISSR